MMNIDKHGKITVKDLRLRAQKTQAQVAEEVGVSRRNFAAWEKGGVIPTLDKAIRFAIAVNASVSEMCLAFGVDSTGLNVDVMPASSKDGDSNADNNTSIAARLLANKSPEELEALFTLFGHKNDGGLAPPSSQ